MENVKEWTSLPMTELFKRASRTEDWKRNPVESSVMSLDDPIGQGTKLN